MTKNNGMNETKFTPGPWCICIQDDDDRAFTVFARSQLKKNRISADDWDDCICAAGLNHENFEANAHLISAAPELYEALEITAELVEALGHTAKKARAALAKARGEI